MDPDIVLQQLEAEREALALAKQSAAPPPAGQKIDNVPTPLAPVFFGTELASAIIEEVVAISETAAGFSSGAEVVHSEPPRIVPPAEEPAILRVGRLFFFGLGGAVAGGGAGAAATSYLQLPLKMAEVAILGPAGALAVCSAVASQFVGLSKGAASQTSASGTSGA